MTNTSSTARKLLDAAAHSDFQRDGVLIVPSVYSQEEIDRLMAVLFRLFRKSVPEFDVLDGLKRPWMDPRFDAEMLALRARDPREFGAMYDTIQGSAVFQRFVCDGRALRIAGEILHDDPEHLAVSGFLFRMDPPFDQRNALTWHQDHTYFPHNYDGENGLVFWVAMRDVPPEMGPLDVCPGSHREGLVDLLHTGKADYGTTEQREVDPALISKYEVRPAPAGTGDVVIVNLNTFHRSGANRSERIRFSALCRYHRMTADDYVPFRIYHKFNDYRIDRIIESHDRDETVRRLYDLG